MGAEGESTDTSAAEAVLINVRCSNGTKIAVRAALESTVADFKELVAQNCDVPAPQQRLIYKGRILKDDQTLHSYGLQAEHTVHMVRGFAPSGSTSTTPTVNAPAGGNVNSAATAPGATVGAGTEGATGGAGLGASIFPGVDFNFLGGNGNLGAGIPGFDQMQQQFAQNPNLMRDIMNTPAVQSLMNNPDLMRTMIMNNPQTREIIDRNPELAHILNDPSIIRQTLETARNPELMREMMRNTDRAMSNIESSPEGFNMLRRMYENVQEPFLNATAGGAGNDTASNPFAALLGNQGGGGAQPGTNVPNNGSDSTGAVPNTNPLPNPWGAPQTNTASRTPSNAPTAAGVGGLGGLGLPDLDRLSSGMPDAALMNQLLQNPAMSQMMQSVFSNPQYMNQLLNFNPQMRTLLDSNPQLCPVSGDTLQFHLLL
uniref:Ubiquitin-like domain-containing protein n=1 Tax=Kalanchoe fedtschenkoi TaxID=63787 RepID=A0A7N0VHK8_KALFE